MSHPRAAMVVASCTAPDRQVVDAGDDLVGEADGGVQFLRHLQVTGGGVQVPAGAVNEGEGAVRCHPDGERELFVVRIYEGGEVAVSQ